MLRCRTAPKSRRSQWSDQHGGFHYLFVKIRLLLPLLFLMWYLCEPVKNLRRQEARCCALTGKICDQPKTEAYTNVRFQRMGAEFSSYSFWSLYLNRQNLGHQDGLLSFWHKEWVSYRFQQSTSWSFVNRDGSPSEMFDYSQKESYGDQQAQAMGCNIWIPTKTSQYIWRSWTFEKHCISIQIISYSSVFACLWICLRSRNGWRRLL